MYGSSSSCTALTTTGTDREHLNYILQICGSPDEELMSKIDSEDVSLHFSPGSHAVLLLRPGRT